MQTTEEQLTDVGFFPHLHFKTLPQLLLSSNWPLQLTQMDFQQSVGGPLFCTQCATTAGLWVSVSMKIMQIYRGAVKKDDK